MSTKLGLIETLWTYVCVLNEILRDYVCVLIKFDLVVWLL